MKNLLIGAISTNYGIDDIQNWVASAKKVLTQEDDIYILLYNFKSESELVPYLESNGVNVLTLDFDLFGSPIDQFETNTGLLVPATAYKLVHNIRFLHIWRMLLEIAYVEVLITDVKDVIINKRPFGRFSGDEYIVASSEVIRYQDHDWNKEHIHQTFGIASFDLLSQDVNNVGVILGKGEVIKHLCLDIYLNAINKVKVADQTAFNYLINNSYKCKTIRTDLKDKWAVHLHVINEGRVPFDLHTLSEYTIIHQYDRLGNEIQYYYTLPK
jgi:hypothetical protein